MNAIENLIGNNQEMVENIGSGLLIFLVAVGTLWFMLLFVVNLIKSNIKKSLVNLALGIVIAGVGVMGYNSFKSFMQDISPNEDVFQTSDAGSVIEEYTEDYTV